jgi:Flp pilus assembly protein TadG
VKIVISLGGKLRKKWHRRRNRPLRRPRDAGQALVEVAIALPVLLALLIGIFEFARAYNVKQVITNAAREGAREAVLPSATQAGVQTVVNGRLSDAGVSSATITVGSVGVSTGSPVSVTVSVSYNFVFIGPVLKLLSPGATDPGTINLQATSTMRKE